MNQFSIKNGSREVVVTEQAGRYTATLYVNNGEAITFRRWTGKTENGARRWADHQEALKLTGKGFDSL